MVNVCAVDVACTLAAKARASRRVVVGFGRMAFEVGGGGDSEVESGVQRLALHNAVTVCGLCVYGRREQSSTASWCALVTGALSHRVLRLRDESNVQ